MRYDLLRLSLCSKICPTVSVLVELSRTVFFYQFRSRLARGFSALMLWPTPPKRGFFVRVPHASRGVFRQTCSVRVKRPVLTSRLAFLLGYATAARGVSDPSRAVFLPVSVPGSPNYRSEQKKIFRKLEKKIFFRKFSKSKNPARGVGKALRPRER